MTNTGNNSETEILSRQASELVIANKELAHQNEEKEKRAAELIIANKELTFQNEEKEKRAAELARSKQLLNETERLARIGGWEIDLKKNELIWSDVVYQIHEVDPNYQPTVESAINFYTPEAIPVISEGVRRAIEEGKSYDVDLQLITAKQNRIWVRAIGRAYRVDGEIVKIGGVFQDINERILTEHQLILANKELVFQNEEKEKRAAELIIANKELLFQNEEKEKRATELNENKTLLASILDSSLSGIMAFKSIRNAEGAIMDFEWQLVNNTAEKMVSHSQTKILGKRLLEEMPGNRVEGLFDLYVQVVETGITLDHEHYYEHEKVKTWFRTVAIKRFDGFVVTFSNITERKLAEQELIITNNELHFQNEEKEKRAAELIKALEKAQESDNLKSAFLRNLSHEIRTPMNQILGFANLLKDSDLTEVTRDEYIGIINSQSHQLLHIITDIVEISKISTGQIDLNLVTFNLGIMMDVLLVSFKPKAEHRNLQLRLSKKIADTEALIRGDEVKLNQIFSNLIENAIKFTNAGSVDIEYSRVGDKLIIAVKDTGIGIEEQEKQIIFDHFRQIEITTMRQYGGLGLGLSISNAYIRMMSGIIRVESESGKGSTFFVEIPYLPAVCISESTMNVLQIPVIYRPDWQDKTLLIAEDEESNMYFLKEVLRSTGIHLLFAVNGLEAVEQCKIHPEIALVLMDIRMPRMDGIEATKIIKSFRNDLPVIATTAFAMASEKEYILDAGCNDYISKPIKKDELLALIQKHFNKLEN